MSPVPEPPTIHATAPLSRKLLSTLNRAEGTSEEMEGLDGVPVVDGTRRDSLTRFEEIFSPQYSILLKMI